MKITGATVKKQIVLGALSAIGALAMTWAVRRWLMPPPKKAEVIDLRSRR